MISLCIYLMGLQGGGEVKGVCMTCSAFVIVDCMYIIKKCKNIYLMDYKIFIFVLS